MIKLLRYRAVLFDLDGTLFDAGEGILSSIRHALDLRGLPYPDDARMRSFIGPPLRESFVVHCGILPDDVEQAVDDYHAYFITEGLTHYRVYTGIRTLLQTLRKNGVYTAVATSKPQGLANRVLQQFHLDKLFDCIVGESDRPVKSGKEQLIRRALPDFPLSECAMVGDRCFDMEGAKAVGIDGIGAGYGYGSLEELQAAGAVHYAATVAELQRILCGEVLPEKGLFLSMEGPDGSGKTTQMNRVEAWLSGLGFDVLRTREPGGSPIGEKIRQVLLDVDNKEMCPVCEALLYAASRAQHVQERIRPAVEAGKLVLCDRFVDSSVAYQGGGRSLGVSLVRQINEPAVDGCLPDVTVYLAIDREVALKRRCAASELDRLEQEGLAFHTRVQQAYEEQLRKNPERFLIVDAAKDVDAVTEEIKQKLAERLAL